MGIQDIFMLKLVYFSLRLAPFQLGSCFSALHGRDDLRCRHSPRIAFRNRTWTVKVPTPCQPQIIQLRCTDQPDQRSTTNVDCAKAAAWFIPSAKTCAKRLNGNTNEIVLLISCIWACSACIYFSINMQYAGTVAMLYP